MATEDSTSGQVPSNPRDGGEAVGTLALGVAAESNLRWAAVDLGGVVEDARARHDLSPLSAVALGRAMAAAALLQRFSSKAPERLIFEVRGDGPLGKVVTEVDSEGNLRGLVGEPRLPNPASGSMSIGEAVGQGLLRVTRESERGTYNSQVALVSGEIGGDLVHFLEQSQQIRSAALLGVLPRASGITAAGGVLIEAFPGVDDDVVTHLEGNIGALGGGISDLLESGGIPTLLDTVFRGFDRQELERYPLLHRCRCRPETLRESLRQVPDDELRTIADERGNCVAVCAFCSTQYRFSLDELTMVS